jgi:hypothetical protein
MSPDRTSGTQPLIDADGVVLVDPSGRKRSHPLMAAESQIRGVLLRAWNQLDLTDDEKPKIGRPSTRQ